MLTRLIDETGVTPAVNQVELHPYFPQGDLRAFHAEHGIRTESWSPLARRSPSCCRSRCCRSSPRSTASHPTQIVLRWHVQLGSTPIPKSADPDRQRENADVFGFELTDDEVGGDLRARARATVGCAPRHARGDVTPRRGTRSYSERGDDRVDVLVRVARAEHRAVRDVALRERHDRTGALRRRAPRLRHPSIDPARVLAQGSRARAIVARSRAAVRIISSRSSSARRRLAPELDDDAGGQAVVGEDLQHASRAHRRGVRTSAECSSSCRRGNRYSADDVAGQFALAREVRVDRPRRQARLLDDVGDRRVVHALALEAADRRLRDLVAPRSAVVIRYSGHGKRIPILLFSQKEQPFSLGVVMAHASFPRLIPAHQVVGRRASTDWSARVVIALLIMAFVWPAATSQREEPAGRHQRSGRACRRTRGRARRAGSRAVHARRVDSRDDAVSQIESRELYGAILLDEPEVLVATAAEPGGCSGTARRRDAAAGADHRGELRPRSSRSCSSSAPRSPPVSHPRRLLPPAVRRPRSRR